MHRVANINGSGASKRRSVCIGCGVQSSRKTQAAMQLSIEKIVRLTKFRLSGVFFLSCVLWRLFGRVINDGIIALVFFPI